MMFTGAYSGRLAEVFGDYYKNRAGSNTIVKAYAAYNSFNYVIRKEKLTL